MFGMEMRFLTFRAAVFVSFFSPFIRRFSPFGNQSAPPFPFLLFLKL